MLNLPERHRFRDVMIKLYNLISIGEASPTFGHENAFFYRPYKESISKEVNNDKIKICI